MLYAQSTVMAMPRRESRARGACPQGASNPLSPDPPHPPTACSLLACLSQRHVRILQPTAPNIAAPGMLTGSRPVTTSLLCSFVPSPGRPIAPYPRPAHPRQVRSSGESPTRWVQSTPVHADNSTNTHSFQFLTSALSNSFHTHLLAHFQEVHRLDNARVGHLSKGQKTGHVGYKQ